MTSSPSRSSRASFTTPPAPLRAWAKEQGASDSNGRSAQVEIREASYGCGLVARGAKTIGANGEPTRPPILVGDDDGAAEARPLELQDPVEAVSLGECGVGILSKGRPPRHDVRGGEERRVRHLPVE